MGSSERIPRTTPGSGHGGWVSPGGIYAETHETLCSEGRETEPASATDE